ncbi:ATP-binding protein [Paenibacillus lentus]|uniref:histidine kinase n=1 Tax=Paenibacillus lentus TaxID=1338368 RepID=A0A3Q8S8P1_9BACL|nr:ATP-binding protein [Paenibacillus lentus]AZK44847.1 PAS domain-containing sensor histidine kinase [Paenibacillus lentus]
MDAIKEIVIQLFVASLPAFLFPILYEKWSGFGRRPANVEPKSPYSLGMAAICAASMLLCALFSQTYSDIIPLEFGIMPLFVLMLYSRLRLSIVMGVFRMALFPLYAVNYTITGWLLETGLLLFPFILWSAGRFRERKQQDRTVILFLWLAIGQIMVTASPLLTVNLQQAHVPALIVVSTVHLASAAIVSSLYSYYMASSLEKERQNKHVMQLTNQYFSEADKLQQIMDAAPLNIILIDQQRCILSVNDTFLQLYRNDHPSATRGSLIGQKLGGECGGFDIGLIALRVEKALQEGTKTTELLQIEDKVYFTSMSPIIQGLTDEVIAAVIIVQDITELETLRMELNHVERLSLVGQMAAGITHEIRNPMAVVRGFLQLMREKSANDLDHYYRIVMEELDRANSIISDFLALAQNRVVTKELCSLHHIIEELKPLLWAEANLRGQSIEVKLDERVPLLYLNVKEIKQLILNLARNGMEAMGEKGLLTLMTSYDEDGIKLCVIDSGPGLSEVQQQKLFAPFYTTKAKGTGLGLPLCLSIMERHGGNITVRSEEGVGTTFTCVFSVDPSSPHGNSG